MGRKGSMGGSMGGFYGDTHTSLTSDSDLVDSWVSKLVFSLD